MFCFKQKILLIFFVLVAQAGIEAAWSGSVILPISPASPAATGVQDDSGDTAVIWLDTGSNQYLSSTYLIRSTELGPRRPTSLRLLAILA